VALLFRKKKGILLPFFRSLPREGENAVSYAFMRGGRGELLFPPRGEKEKKGEPFLSVRPDSAVK